VLDRAEELARAGREDAQAVAELRSLSVGRKTTLRQAERASRIGGYHHELAQANLTNRLLKAALARQTTPTTPSARDKERIEMLDGFTRLSRDEQWARLTRDQPALPKLQSEVDAGRFGDITNHDLLRVRTHTHDTGADEHTGELFSSPRPSSTDDEIRRFSEQNRGQIELRKELETLVGPSSKQNDLVISSQIALEAATAHLFRFR
jgi:hypothetical protein